MSQDEGIDWLPILIGLAVALGLLILIAGLMWGCKKMRGNKYKQVIPHNIKE